MYIPSINDGRFRANGELHDIPSMRFFDSTPECLDIPSLKITHEDGWLEKQVTFWDGLFFLGAMLVSESVYIYIYTYDNCRFYIIYSTPSPK